MTQLARASATSRIFSIAAILGLTLSLAGTVALQGILLLAAVAATAVAADFSARLPQQWVLFTEAGLAALVVGSAFPEGALLLLYLVVPGLVAGIALKALGVAVTVGIEVVGLTTALLLSGQGGVAVFAEYVGPWIATSAGVGLVAARLRQLRAPGSDMDTSYESARQLLTQLRTVARRLSTGLDTPSIAGQLLAAVHEHLSDTRSAAFVRTEGGVLAPLGYRGGDAREVLQSDGYLVEDCWTAMKPLQGLHASNSDDPRYRIVLPLRVGVRILGVVVIDRAAPVSESALSSIMHTVNEHALRIDAALLFDEVRSLATMEERHRLAREIHDGIAQEIASLGYVVDDLTATASSDSQGQKLNALRAELTRIVNELRLSIFDLRSELSAGLGSAISDYVREVGSRSGLTVHLTLDVVPTRLRGEVETEFLRIAQEAINNVRKHSQASNLWVDCRIHPPYARISIRDDGNGMGSARADSYGMKIMQERSERVGADFSVRAVNGAGGPPGTVVTVTLDPDLQLTARAVNHKEYR